MSEELKSLLTNADVDKIWESLSKRGCGKSRYDIAREIAHAATDQLRQRVADQQAEIDHLSKVNLELHQGLSAGNSLAESDAAEIEKLRQRVAEQSELVADLERRGAKLGSSLYRAENILRRYPHAFAEYRDGPPPRGCDDCGAIVGGPHACGRTGYATASSDEPLA
jgi:chromosome segregation ATPase